MARPEITVTEAPAEDADLGAHGEALQTLAGYRIEKRLGSGGWSVVYRARRDSDGRLVALKVPFVDPVKGGEVGERFVRETRLIAGLSHPHIVAIVESGSESGRTYLAMELLDGETLAAVLAREGALALEAAMDTLLPIVAAVAFAHARGVVHRDIKPANIFMALRPGEGVSPTLLDFGVAKAMGTDEALTLSGATLGTPYYMSPEQAQAVRNVTLATDQWSLAVVLYECITGQRPFRGAGFLGLLNTITAAVVTPPSALRRELPEALDAVFLRALSRDPARRYPTTRAFGAALLPFASEAARARWARTFASPPENPPTGEGGAPPGDLGPVNSEQGGGLPDERDRFVGRSAELDALHALVRGSSRLLSVQGIGGAGKTRFVAHYARVTLGAWPGGVWFCELSEARDADDVILLVARRLGVARAALAPVGRALTARGRCLVILDNVEQLATAIHEVLGAWLAAAPEASFVLTTREAIGAEGEVTFALAPMSHADGVELFAERARSERRDLALNPDDLAAVSETVRLLDGLPLAIELAAARMRVMTARQIHERIGDRFRLLTRRSSGDDRHATFRAVLEWSWSRLAPWEQSALAQMSVFAGGFSVGATEAVVDLAPWPEAPWIVDVLESLVERSLLRHVLDDRFQLLVSVRDHAAEQLRATGDPAAVLAVERRHGVWAASLCTPGVVDTIDGCGDLQRALEVGREMDHLLMACRRAVERRDVAVAVATGRVICGDAVLRGPYRRAAEFAERLLGLTELASVDRAEFAWLAGRTRFAQGELAEAEAHLKNALALTRESGHRARECLVLCVLGDVLREQGEVEGFRASVQQAVVLARRVEDTRVAAVVRLNQGHIDRFDDRNIEAEEHYTAALDLARAAGDQRTEGVILGNLLGTAVDMERFEELQRRAREALALHRAIGDRRSEQNARTFLALSLHRLGRLTEARTCFETLLAEVRASGDVREEFWITGRVGLLSAQMGDLSEGARLLARSEARLRELGALNYLAEILVGRAEVACLAGDLTVARTTLAEADAVIAGFASGDLLEAARAAARVREQLDRRSGPNPPRPDVLTTVP